MSKGSGGTRATNSRSAHGSGANSGGGSNNPNQSRLAEMLTRDSARFAGDWDSDVSTASLEKAASKIFGIKNLEVHDNMAGNIIQHYDANVLQKALLNTDAREVAVSNRSEDKSTRAIANSGIGGGILKYTTTNTTTSYIVGGKYLIQREITRNIPKSVPDGVSAHNWIETKPSMRFHIYQLKSKYRDK